MAKVIKSPDCGNSPKNLLVQALVIAIETSNRTAFSRLVSDDLTWALPARRSFDGKAAALAYLKSRGKGMAHKLIMRRVISHGHAGSGDGTVVLASGLTRGFCHVVEFVSAKGQKVASISSYYSELGDET